MCINSSIPLSEQLGLLRVQQRADLALCRVVRVDVDHAFVQVDCVTEGTAAATGAMRLSHDVVSSIILLLI